MNTKQLEVIINSLDPKYHKHLIENLKNSPGYNEVNSNAGGGVSYDLVLELMRKAMNSLNEKYIEGTVAYIDKFYPSIGKEINNVEVELNRRAKEYNEGKTAIEEFKLVLDTWYNVNLKGIEIYRNTIFKKRQ